MSTHALKWSPLCSHKDGGEIYFTAKIGVNKFRINFSAAMLAACCGADAPEAQRKAWVTEQRKQLVPTLTADQPIPNHLSEVLVEEIS